MKYVFFGTPEFAATVLEKLIEGGFIPAAVVCNPDRPVGRKKVMTRPPVKQLIADGKWQTEILQPEDPKAISYKLKALRADFFVVAAYAKILPAEVIKIPHLGTIGVHPSLLPKYRGATPIQSVILNGEAETGVTLYLLDEKMDHGAIVASAKFQIPCLADRQANSEVTYEELLRRLAELGGNLLVETLPKFLAGEITPQEQDHSQATYTKKFATEDAFIESADLAEAESGANSEKAFALDRKIRALNPEPGVWTYAKALANPEVEQAHYGASKHIRIDEKDYSKRVKLLEAEISNSRLKLKKIQIEGEKPKTAS